MSRAHRQTELAGRGVTEQQFFSTQGKLSGGYVLDLDSLSLGDDDPARAYLGSLAPGSRPAQWLAIKRIVEIVTDGEVAVESFEWAGLNTRDVLRLRRYVVEHLAPATGRRYLAALRGVVEMAWQLKIIDGERLARLTHKRALKPIRGESSPPGRALDRSEVRRLFEHCADDATPAGPRDAAILALLYGGGLRRLEVVNLDVEDVDMKAGEILVSGKGRRERRVPLPSGAVEALRDWLRVRGNTAGPLVLPLGPDGPADDGRRLSPSAICASLRRRSRRCGVKDFTVHDLRRTYISDLLEDGRELEVVARLVGHRNVNTTARYDRRGDARARRAAEGRDVPFASPRRDRKA